MMDNISQKRIWLYGSIRSDMVNGKIVGSSQHAEAESHFPQSGLTPAMQAAIRGDIEILLIENQVLLDALPDLGQELIKTFQDYGVEVRSWCSRESNNS